MSVTDWLNKGRPIMSNDVPNPRTDAEFLADVAISALQGGRYELARELTRLAAQAKYIETTAQPRMVPMLGQTREEQPGHGPTGNGDTEMAATAQITVPANGRCMYMTNGIEECNAVAYWREDAGRGHTGTWLHVDPALDERHAPVVTNWVEGTH